VFSYTQDAVYGHAAFNIDWGSGTGGMQDGRGHRMAIMSIDGDYTNVGIAMVSESDPATAVGPLVTTGNYCNANTLQPNHYNRFIVGTVWNDLDSDGMYDPGEGVGNVTVMPNSGMPNSGTSNSGGYAIPIGSPGNYTLTFSGAVNAVRSVTVGAESVLLDDAFTAPTSSCPSCPGGAVVLNGVTFPSGETCPCAGTTISLLNVTVPNNATANFTASTSITVGSGTTFENGSNSTLTSPSTTFQPGSYVETLTLAPLQKRMGCRIILTPYQSLFPLRSCLNNGDHLTSHTRYCGSHFLKETGYIQLIWRIEPGAIISMYLYCGATRFFTG
jgi:hypothetical protein